MDRKLIHIDELVKTKLRGEADASGMQQSWHKMEQLLNEQDEKTGGSFWKTGSWLLPVLLALITTTSIGGYWWANKMNRSGETAYTPAKMQTLPVSTSVAVQDETALPVTKESQDNGSIMHHTVIAKAAVGEKEGANYNDKRSAPAVGENPSRTQQKKASKKISSTDNSENKTGNIERIVVDEYGYASNINGNKNETSPAVASADNKVLPVHNVEHLRKSNKQLETEVKRDIRDEKYVIDKNDRILKKEERMVNTTNVRERTVREIKEEITTKVYDTVGKERYALIEYIPVSKEEIIALQKLTLYRSQSEMNIADKILIEPMYGATATASRDNESPVESLASANAGAGINAASGSEESVLTKINQFFEIRKRFYTSLFLGANTSADHWVPLGFQIGGGLHYWASKKWTLGIEPTYAFRPMQYTFEDKASTFTQTSPGVPTGSGQYIINYEERSAVKSYSFNSVQSFELPVLAGYHFGNWTVLAGPSVTFGLPLTYYKMEYNNVTPKVITQNNPELNMESTELRSTSEDFNARIGFGYMLGANYNLNDRFGLNFRFSQMLGDNSKTNIGKQLSDEMFKAPSFRVGVHYKLGKTKKVMYMMDKNKR